MIKRVGLVCLGLVGLVGAVGACTAEATDDTSQNEDAVTQTGAKATRFVHTASLQEGEVTFCLTRHPLDPKVVKFSRCASDANTASDADTFQVVTLGRGGVFSFKGDLQMAVNAATKTLSFVRPGACSTGASACVEAGAGGLTVWDSVRRERRTLGAAMAGASEDALASGADNARDAHLRFVDQSNLRLQAVTRPMDGIATGCAINPATRADSCAGQNEVCRMESVDHCKTRCPIAAGPELWTCLDACDRPGTVVSPYYERVGYCGPKNIVERCQDGDPDVVACMGSQVWAGGFGCKERNELFRCDDGQTCRSFVSAVTRDGQRKSVDQLKRELCKARTAGSPTTSDSQP